MTSTPKKSTEAEDVLEFLNSLPENKDKSGAFKAKNNKTSSGKDKEDVLDFLDELEKSDFRKKESKKATKAVTEAEAEAKSDTDIKQTQSEAPSKEEPVNEKEETTVQVNDDGSVITKTKDQEGDEEFIDPIASISNWWSSSGSNAVSSLWNNAKSIQQKATEEASKLANEATKKLGDEKEHVERLRKINAFQFLSENFESILNNLNVDQYDEFLKIYLIHDLINFDTTLESLIKSQFKKVLKQVQGDIFIEIVKQNTISKDTQRRYSVGNHNQAKNLNLFEGGIADGDKLNWANLNASIKATETSKESNEKETSEEPKEGTENLNISKIFISILPIQNVLKKSENEEFQTIDSSSSDSFQFRIILKDIGHKISLVSETQSFPIKWANWIQYQENLDLKKSEETKKDDDEEEANQEEESDNEIDPAEWVKDWIDQGLGLTIGVLAQQYVIKRMGF